MTSTLAVHPGMDEILFEQAAQGVAVIDGEAFHSYEFVRRQVRRQADLLIQHGARTGDRIAVYLDKTIEAVVAILSVWAAGGILVPINEGLRSRQVEYILRHSESRFLLSNARKCAPLQPDLSANVAVLPVTLESDGGEPDIILPRRGRGQAAAILYTSGSTGLPKGILISHDNLVAGARIVSRYLHIREQDRIISILPFSFDYGLNQLLVALYCGATLVLQRSHYPADICRTLEASGVTVMAAVPPLWIQLMQDHSPFSTMSFPTLRCITNSGGVFPKDLVRRYRRALPHTDIYLMYGLSEAFRSTFLPPDQIDSRPDSIGKAIPETSVHVVHESGDECAPGEIGELVHSGPTVALGYWQDPAATRAVFRSAPFAVPSEGGCAVYSGDLVYKDKEGYVYFVGRRDELMKCYGYRVSPDEVEGVIFSSGTVNEVAVCGRPDEVGGTALIAHVVPRDPLGFGVEQLRAYCRREMPGYMVPKDVVTHESLPRTSTGKIDRRALKSLSR